MVNGKVDSIEFMYVLIYVTRKCSKSVFIVVAAAAAAMLLSFRCDFRCPFHSFCHTWILHDKKVLTIVRVFVETAKCESRPLFASISDTEIFLVGFCKYSECILLDLRTHSPVFVSLFLSLPFFHIYLECQLMNVTLD